MPSTFFRRWGMGRCDWLELTDIFPNPNPTFIILLTHDATSSGTKYGYPSPVVYPALHRFPSWESARWTSDRRIFSAPGTIVAPCT